MFIRSKKINFSNHSFDVTDVDAETLGVIY